MITRILADSVATGDYTADQLLLAGAVYLVGFAIAFGMAAHRAPVVDENGRPVRDRVDDLET